MNSFNMKVQLGDKVKMLPKSDYQTVKDLTDSAQASYPKRLANKEIKLKYADDEGDWLYLSDDADVNALKEHASSLKGKKVKLVIDIIEKKDDKQVEEVKQALEDVKLDDNQNTEEEKEAPKVKFEDLKDFKFADAIPELEALLNSEEKIRPWQLAQTVKKVTEGTKAERHVKRFLRKFMKRGFSHGFRKGGRRGFGGKRCHKDISTSESRSPDFHPHGPMGAAPFMFHPGMVMGGPFAGKPCLANGMGGDRKSMKFFRKFMKQFKDNSSSDSSSEERKAERLARRQKRMEERKEKSQKCQQNRKEHAAKRPIIVKQPSDTIITTIDANTVDVDLSVTNGSPWPLWLTGVTKVSGDENITFEEIKLNERLHGDNELDVQLKVTLPAQAGDYSATFGFLNKQGKQTPGETATVNFRVTE